VNKDSNWTAVPGYSISLYKLLMTGSIGLSEKRQYLGYSEGDFEIYHPVQFR